MFDIESGGFFLIHGLMFISSVTSVTDKALQRFV
jgi:hypothetical protein